MTERIEHVTADDGCALWTVRSGDDAADPGHGFILCHGGPGFWDTLVTIDPSPPLRNFSTATAVSSTATVGWFTFAQYPHTSSTGPRNHCSKSRWWADWLTSTPPPSVSHRPRHGSDM